MTRPLVSVVMGVRNGMPGLAAALSSLREQTLEDIEIIVVNDGSEDGTTEYLDDVARQDPRVRHLRQEPRGLTRALIAGCEASRGEFVARHDADDFSPPTRFQAQVDALRSNPGASMATSWVEDVPEGGGPARVHEAIQHSIAPEDGGEAVSLIGIPAHGSVMMRRAALEACGGYRPEFYYAQDSDLWLRILDQGPVHVVPEVLYRRTLAEGSISARFPGVQSRFARLAQRAYFARRAADDEAPVLADAAALAEQCRRAATAPPTRREQARALRSIGMQLEDVDPGLALDYHRRAAWRNPLDHRVLRSLLRSVLLLRRRRARRSDPSAP